MKTFKGFWLQLLQFTLFIFLAGTASAQLKAGFTATPSSGCPPMVVNFKDSSTGNPTTWKWDLGNGTISYLQNPIATYFNAGTYTIKLIIGNDNGADTLVKTNFIVVNSTPLSVFGASDTTGCFPLKVQFTDSSSAGSGTIVTWQWDFGDGTLSNEQNPEHTYTSSGNFTVILRVINSNGCAHMMRKLSYIKIKDGVKANFSFASTQGCRPPSIVAFTNESAGTGAISYKWDFGDGESSSEDSPKHSYQNAGVYTVKLIALNSVGCTDTIIKPNAINIGFIKAAFTTPTTICAGNVFQLTNTSKPATYTGVKWDFGDSTTSNLVNPQKTYSAPGTYNIKLVADFGSCQDSVIKVIDVLPPPNASFKATNNIACKPPVTVSFDNNTADAVSYLWLFGDGTTSTAKNPTHTYTAGGNQTVTLIVKNASGCTDTLKRENFVRIAPPKIAEIKNLHVKGCLPFTVTPVARMSDSMPVISYFWDFGDGFTSTDSAPSHTYTTPGAFAVKLVIVAGSGCTDSMTVTDAVKAGNRPVVAFSADPRDVCAFSPVVFADETTGGEITEWYWTFGDGSNSIEQHPIHQYNDTGYFKVTLVSYNFGCSDTLEKIDYVHVRPPIAKFDTAYLCNLPLDRTFINKSIGATSWAWDFGDGATSPDEQVAHTYAAPGVYQVSLKVSNGTCEHTTKKDVVVIDEKGRLEVSDSVSCINTRIIFNVANVSAGNISTYAWYFSGLGQSVIVTANNPVAAVYGSAGERLASVVLTDILKCRDTLYIAVPVKTYGPRAAFASPNPNTCFGNTVNFADSTKTDGIHNIITWKWSFGEGPQQTFASAPFSHDYSATGLYDVKLLVTDSYGCKDSMTRPLYVSITKPAAKFTTSDSLICPVAPVTFTNNSQGVSVTYLWDFSDGTTSTVISPVHKFADTGIFLVKMLMTDKNGCQDSAFKSIKVFTAVADFTLSDSFSTCPPLIVNMTNKSTNSIQQTWDFGDGGNSQLVNVAKTYSYPGNYTVKLIVKNNGGCSDTLARKIEIQGPTGKFDYFPKEVCSPGTVNYTLNAQNAVKFVWDYNDGTTIFSTDTKISHTYISPGIFLPKIILEDTAGCKVPVRGLDTIKVNGIKTNILSSATVLCDSGYVSFKDSTSSNDVISGYLWNFGDGTTSTGKNPTHRYTDTGFYTITLITKTAFGCTDKAVVANRVKIINSPDIKIIGDTSACEPARLRFTGGFVKTDTSAVTWAWDFGNGDSSKVQLPDSQSYVNPGTYSVRLKVTNRDGCSDVAVRKAIIHPNPVVNAGADTTICRFTGFTLKATGADSYTWQASPSLSCTNCATPLAKPDKTMTYHVLGKTIFGCKNEDSITIGVKQPFEMQVGKGDTLCVGESFTLRAGGADAYEWTPSRWLDNATSATPKSRPDSTVNYRVIGKDSFNCFKDTGYIRLKVYPIPSVEITNGENIVLQVGTTVKLNTKNSPDVTKWRWFPGQWLSCGSCNNPVAAPREDITYNVTASNDGNCSSSDKVTINLICDNANVYMPNTFSPNGDGVNDIFYPRGSGLFNIKSFKIFNRWGQIVFNRDGISANNPSYGWDGTFNGKPMQNDVYVYLLEVVCVNNVVFPFKGNIALIR